MSDKFNLTKISTGFLALALLTPLPISYADWSIGFGIGNRHEDRHFYRYHDHPHYGYRIHYLPEGYFTIWVAGERYYYDDGLYYSNVGHGEYVLVAPPMGAVVTAIPSDFQPVIINGRPYYANNGVYYVRTRHGYKVVSQPVMVVKPTVVVQAHGSLNPAFVAGDVFTVNVPNNNGGYTAVVINKSGNGFVGPQGEFYSEFPKISQLRVMYGK
ncbi:MAG: hypothetical protein HQL14_04325 [Candidatus Omnitrophica bacterium]|nr:hypothetical protein [Candidatus Omnitrophota bacterium]